MVRIDDIIEYVLYTPCNSNKIVLKSLLESYLKDNGAGGITLEDKIVILPGINGENSFSPENPKPGDIVTITTNPTEGYSVSDVVVVDIEGNQISVTNNGDGTYSYTQPQDGSSVIPIVNYDPIGIDPDSIIVYNGGGVSGW